MHNSSPQTTYELLSLAAKRSPRAIALRFIESLQNINASPVRTYEQLLISLHQSIDMMRGLSGKERPVVSLLLPNIPQAQVLLWSAETAGIANPLNPLLNEEALFQLMSRAQTDLIFAVGPMQGSDLWEKAQRVSARLPGKPICISVHTYGGEELHYDSEVLRYSDQAPTEASLPVADDLAAYYHTGGTTGTPKLACHSHANQTAAALAVIKSLQLSGGDIAINGLPVFHVAGAIVNSLAILAAGGQLVLPTIAGFRSPEVIRSHWRLVDELGVTISSGIPTSMASMLDAPLEGADVSTLRFLLSGGAPVPVRLHVLAQQKIGRQLYQAYGMTESSGVIALPNLSQPAVCGSVEHITAECWPYTDQSPINIYAKAMQAEMEQRGFAINSVSIDRNNKLAPQIVISGRLEAGGETYYTTTISIMGKSSRLDLSIVERHLASKAHMTFRESVRWK